VRHFTWTGYAAKSRSHAHLVGAPIEVTRKGADIRYIVTNIRDRTGPIAISQLANQTRLILHTAAYW
jgi:hypothetical protein